MEDVSETTIKLGLAVRSPYRLVAPPLPAPPPTWRILDIIASLSPVNGHLMFIYLIYLQFSPRLVNSSSN